MGGGRVFMGLGRMLVSFGCVLVGFLVVTLDVVLGCKVVMLGCFLVVLRGFVVCFVCHFRFSCGRSPGRDPTRPFVKSSLLVAEDLQSWQEIHELSIFNWTEHKKMPPIGWEVICIQQFIGVSLSRGDNERIDDQGLDCSLGENLRHAYIGIAAGSHVDKHHIRGIFRAGSTDVELTNGLDCYSSEKKSVCYLNAGRINQFRAHRASRFSG
jgi:hypothetical protein